MRASQRLEVEDAHADRSLGSPRLGCRALRSGVVGAHVLVRRIERFTPAFHRDSLDAELVLGEVCRSEIDHDVAVEIDDCIELEVQIHAHERLEILVAADADGRTGVRIQ